MRRMRWATLALVAAFVLLSRTAWPQHLPEGFVYLDQEVPGILVELRYSTKDNFVGDPIDGYIAPRCITTRPAAEALKGVQEELSAFEPYPQEWWHFKLRNEPFPDTYFDFLVR